MAGNLAEHSLDLKTIESKKGLVVLGIMSGTSLDSVDYALCQVQANRIRLRHHWQVNFPESLRRRVLAAAQGGASSHDAGQLHHDLGRLYAKSAAGRMSGFALDLAGLHGQTIFHQPNPPAATFQIGEPAYLAEALRVPVVSNFRAADMAAGGQGAPLATLFHQIVFGKKGDHVCFNNLGGISNVTSIDWRRGASPRLLAFDTGPGNMLIDLAVQQASQRRFDKNGAWARRGVADEALIQTWLKHPFFKRKPPKSTGREQFGETFFEKARVLLSGRKASKYDVAAMLTELTAASLALNYEQHLKSKPKRVVFGGGGAANPFLMKRIRERLRRPFPGIEIMTCDELGWPAQSIEPAAFALLAYYRFMGLPANLPATTGAQRPVMLGQIAEP